MKLKMVSKQEKISILKEINTVIGSKNLVALEELIWLDLPSGIWAVSTSVYKVVKQIVISLKDHKFQFAGVFLGKLRHQFGLSLESLYFIKNAINRYIILEDKLLEKFLYGKSVKVKKHEFKDNILFNINSKIVIMTADIIPVGIASIRSINKGYYTIKPIIDLGIYLRKQKDS